MNIVYLLTNTSKTEGKRFYIGSKQECQIGKVDGIPTILDRDGKPYYSSSTSYDFREDMLRGDVFVASLLEDVIDRSSLLQVENSYIEKANAVFSEDYYNLSNAVLNCHNQDAIANLYGESVKELAKNNSSTSKRDNSAKDLGFNNFGELCFAIWERYCDNPNWQTVSESFGKERHWANVTVKPFDMEKALLDIGKRTVEDVRKLISRKCSLHKAAQLLEIELPVARILLGDFNKEFQKSYSVAMSQGLTQGELEAAITKDVLRAMPWADVCRKHAVNETSAKRYFMRCIRRHLDPEDISDQILETEEELVEARKKRKNKQTKMIEFKKKIASVDTIVLTGGRQSNNKSGVEGVAKRVACKVPYWYATWIDENGKKKTKSYSINAYGDEEAFKMACETRKQMLEKVKNAKQQ